MEQKLWSGLAQGMASLMFLWAMARQFLPHDLDSYVQKYVRKVWGLVYPYVEVTFHEYSSDSFKRSEAYTSIRTYLSATTSKAAKRLTADIGKDSTGLVLSLDDNEQVTDEFRDIKVWWTSRKTVSRQTTIAWYPAQDDRKYYRLTFHRTHRSAVEDYLKHVMEEGKAIQVRNRQRKLFTNSSGQGGYGHRKSLWSHVVFQHPATFQTLAMDPDKKAEIMEDLETFRISKDFYARVGKAWKRGYLLYGPPGTGKSSMIAAMANHLDYDVYDLELTAVKDNTELRKLLIETTSKSIIVIEDIDCSEDLSNKRKKKEEKTEEEGERPPGAKKEEENKGSKVTLSGLLNFIDGLWSSCGEERLIVFTTNHFEKLDPALIRRGRMDLHIEMSYCCFEAFKKLAKNYLLLDHHPLFEKVKEMIEVEGVKMTPADVAENLMPKSSSASQENSIKKCLESLIEALQKAKEQAVVQVEEGKSDLTEEVVKTDQTEGEKEEKNKTEGED